MNYPIINIVLFLAFLVIPDVSGQVSLEKTEFEGREAYALENDRMRLSMLSGGGYVAELCLFSTPGNESVNPLFIPHYKTIDPHTFKPEIHGDLYGSGKNARLMAGYMGHFLCFPYFGDGFSESEEKLGYSTHGEAYGVKYKVEEKVRKDAAVLTASAMLPMTKYFIQRSFTLLPGQTVLLVEESIENLESFDRAYHRVQHITFGKPFVEYGKTFVDAPVSRIAYSGQEDDPLNVNTVQWPMVSTEDEYSKNAGIFDSDKGQGGYCAWLMDPEREYTWFTIYNKELKLLVGYIFPRDDNSWIGDWQENQHARALPRNRKTVAWGLEVGTTPFGSGLKRSIDRGPLFDTETYKWIGAKEKKEQSYLIFMLEIEKSFRGVQGLEMEKGDILLIERETENHIRIAHGYTIR